MPTTPATTLTDAAISGQTSTRAASIVGARGRCIGQVEAESGPVLIAIGGIHGNEPDGLVALETVLDEIKSSGLELAGSFLALTGHRAALTQNPPVRYMSTDLNRTWTDDRVEAARRGDRDDPELIEQTELLSWLDERLDGDRPVYLLDLHGTSAHGPAFVVLFDDDASRRFARHFPLTKVLGLEEQMAGTLLDHVQQRGATVLGVEGGRNGEPSTLERHVDVIWLALVVTGLVTMTAAKRASSNDPAARLASARGTLPRYFEARYRHAIEADDGFVMLPGFRTFDEVASEQHIADDREGQVLAHENGRLLFPLYQAQGSEGFILGRRVRRLWMGIATIMQRLRFDALLPLLPGVRKHPTRRGAVMVNPAVARYFVVEVFHLCGYRREPAENGKPVFLNRR